MLKSCTWICDGCGIEAVGIGKKRPEGWIRMRWVPGLIVPPGGAPPPPPPIDACSKECYRLAEEKGKR